MRKKSTGCTQWLSVWPFLLQPPVHATHLACDNTTSVLHMWPVAYTCVAQELYAEVTAAAMAAATKKKQDTKKGPAQQVNALA